MRIRTSAMLGTGLLVAILLSVHGGADSVDAGHAAQVRTNHSQASSDASATEYGLLATPDATAIEYGLL